MDEKDFERFSKGVEDKPEEMTKLQNAFLIDLRQELVNGFGSINNELGQVNDRLRKLEYVPIEENGVKHLMKLSDYTIKVYNQVDLLQREAELRNKTREVIKDSIAGANWWGKNILQLIQYLIMIAFIIYFIFFVPRIDNRLLEKLNKIEKYVQE